MTAVVTSGPLVEPVTLDEAKAHLRVDGSDEDTLIAGLITAARTHVESLTGLALNTQGWLLSYDAWPGNGVVNVPVAPIQSVGEVRTLDEEGAPTVIDPAHYFADMASRPPRIVPLGSYPWPLPERKASGIEITLTAGYGDTSGDVPAPLRQAVLLLVAHWFENREPVIAGESIEPVPDTVSALLRPYRRVRL